MRALAVTLALVITACGGPAPDDAGPVGADGAAGVDGGAAGSDAGADGGACVPGEARVLTELGHCFEARTCCVAADCGGERSWVCTADGLCEDSGRACGCVDDFDCAGGAFCLTNAVVCGVCAPTRPPCVADASCATGERCVDGYCVDDTDCMGYP